MIEVKDLCFSYSKNAKDTINNISFKVNKGEIFGFLGPSGAGKSTTQNILIGILKDYRGSVKVLDREIREIQSDYYENIGVAFEFPNFYNKMTALENLKFFQSLYKEAGEDILGLLDMVGLKEHGDKRVSSFSKGMKMRLNFCRAIMNKPEAIFLDEPTSGLDPVNAKIIKDVIQAKKAAGKTIFLTTHNMNVAEELCDRVAFIVDGKIMLIDSPRALKIKHGERSVKVEFRSRGTTENKSFQLEGIGHNNEFLKTLKENEIERMHTQEATLEDIFIKVTGRRLV